MVNGGVAPSIVLEVVAGLPVGSRTVAMMSAEQSGGEWTDWYGKDRLWFAVADLIDATNMAGHVAGNWSKVPAAPKPYPRPGARKVKTFKSFYSEMFQKYGGNTV